MKFFTMKNTTALPKETSDRESFRRPSKRYIFRHVLVLDTIRPFRVWAYRDLDRNNHGVFTLTLPNRAYGRDTVLRDFAPARLGSDVGMSTDRDRAANSRSYPTIVKRDL